MTERTRHAPAAGEVRRGREIGKCPKQRYAWLACERCGALRWVQLKRGKPSARICKPCGRDRWRT